MWLEDDPFLLGLQLFWIFVGLYWNDSPETVFSTLLPVIRYQPLKVYNPPKKQIWQWNIYSSNIHQFEDVFPMGNMVILQLVMLVFRGVTQKKQHDFERALGRLMILSSLKRGIWIASLLSLKKHQISWRFSTVIQISLFDLLIRHISHILYKSYQIWCNTKMTHGLKILYHFRPNVPNLCPFWCFLVGFSQALLVFHQHKDRTTYSVTLTQFLVAGVDYNFL